LVRRDLGLEELGGLAAGILRRTFPELNFRRIPDYSGNGKMHVTDTRCAWVDWIDALSKDGVISHELAQHATL
jgi:hypothetical protein